MNAPSGSSAIDSPAPAWVLHRRPYRESSALVELFTESAGRIGAVARGAGKRGWRGLLEPFNPILIQWRGGGALRTLTHAEPAGRPVRLRGAAVACGFYLSELTLALVHRDDPHPATWRAYGSALAELSNGVREAPLRRFELALLEEAGYGLQLDVDAHGDPLAGGRAYEYRVESGPWPVVQERGVQEQTGVVVDGACLVALAARETLDETTARAARGLLRTVLDHHLGGRTLHSRALFQALRERPRT